MTNKYGEPVTPQYEVVLRTWSSFASHEDAVKNHDVESFHFESADSYADAVKIAKVYSLKKGDVFNGDYGVKEIVDIVVVCYFADSDSEYNEVWNEYYTNGKKEYREII